MEGNGQTRLTKKRNWIPVFLLVIMVGSVLAIGSHVWTIVEADEVPSQIHLTWATNDVYTTMTVSWWTQQPYEDSPVVLYDTDGAPYAWDTEGESNQVADFEGWYHDVELTGLEPGTTYYFICGGDEDGAWSEERGAQLQNHRRR